MHGTGGGLRTTPIDTIRKWDHNTPNTANGLPTGAGWMSARSRTQSKNKKGEAPLPGGPDREASPVAMAWIQDTAASSRLAAASGVSWNATASSSRRVRSAIW